MITEYDRYIQHLIDCKQFQIDDCNERLQSFTAELNLLLGIKRKIRESDGEG